MKDYRKTKARFFLGLFFFLSLTGLGITWIIYSGLTKEVNDIIKTLKVGDSVSFKVYRNGSTGVLKMKLAEYKPSTFKSSNTQEERNDQNSFWNFFNY